MQIPKCAGSLQALERDTRAFAREFCTPPDAQGHMWYTTTRYQNGNVEERCIKCGLWRVRARDGRVLDIWQ